MPVLNILTFLLTSRGHFIPTLEFKPCINASDIPFISIPADPVALWVLTVTSQLKRCTFEQATHKFIIQRHLQYQLH